MEPSHEVTARKNHPPVKESLLSPLETSPRKLNTRLRVRPRSLVALEHAEDNENEYLNGIDNPEMKYQTLPKKKTQSSTSLYRQRKTPPKRSPSSNVKMAPVSEKRHFKSEADLSNQQNTNTRSLAKLNRRKKKQQQPRRLSENSNFYPSDMEIDEEMLLDSESE